MSSIVAEELSHGTAGIRSKVLQGSRIRRRCTDNNCVLHGIGVRQSLHYLGNSRTLLSNSNVDTVQLCLLVLAIVETFLINDCVNCDCCFAINTAITSTITTTTQIK